jgi:hypothetical protein
MRKYSEWTEEERFEFQNENDRYHTRRWYGAIANKAIEIASREPKKKIEKLEYERFDDSSSEGYVIDEITVKINELIDAVNELLNRE